MKRSSKSKEQERLLPHTESNCVVNSDRSVNQRLRESRTAALGRAEGSLEVGPARLVDVKGSPTGIVSCGGTHTGRTCAPVTYLLIHWGGGSITVAGAWPASFRPLPAKRLMARTFMS